MRRLFIILLLIVPSVHADVFEVVTSSSVPSTNTLTIDRTYTVSGGTALDVWAYIPFPQASTYSSMWTQTPVGGQTSLAVWPEAELYEFPEGIWVYWGSQSAITLEARMSSRVQVSGSLPGIGTDLHRQGPTTWYQATARAPDGIAGLAETMAFVDTSHVDGSPKGNVGLVERWIVWMDDNINHDTGNSLGYEANNAREVFGNQVGSCSGFVNLFKAGLSGNYLSNRFGVGVVTGATLSGAETFPGTSLTLTLSTFNGMHAWAVVDDGGQWVPYDPYHGTMGLATRTRVAEGVFEDEEDGNARIEWSYLAGQPMPSVSGTTTVTGIPVGATYTAKEQRNPYDDAHFAAQWISASHLKPDPPTDAMLDLSKRNTFLVAPNPAAGWTQIQLFLERDARVALLIYDVRGRLIERVRDEYRSAGYFLPLWQPPDTLANGTYFLRVALNGQLLNESKKIVLVR